METNSGTRPATPASPAHSATHTETPHPLGLAPNGSKDSPEDIDAYLGIEDTFRRKLTALRRLRLSDRPYALRAARDERHAALRGLKERRAFARQAERLLRRVQTLSPG